jgi:hypothetical protein
MGAGQPRCRADPTIPGHGGSEHQGPDGRLHSLEKHKKHNKSKTLPPNQEKARFTPQQAADTPAAPKSTSFGPRSTPKYSSRTILGVAASCETAEFRIGPTRPLPTARGQAHSRSWQNKQTTHPRAQRRPGSPHSKQRIPLPPISQLHSALGPPQSTLTGPFWAWPHLARLQSSLSGPLPQLAGQTKPPRKPREGQVHPTASSGYPRRP